MTIGAYHYARYDLNADPISEVNHWIAVAGNQFKSGFLVPMLDVEAASQSAATVSSWVNAFENDFIAATGIRPVFYTYLNYAQTKLDSSVGQWPLDMASPNGQSPQTGAPNLPAQWSTWVFWQYGSPAVPGVSSSACDVDTFNGSSLGSWIIPGVPVTPNPSNGGTTTTTPTLD